jgi:UDP-N-acetylmuramoyl-L-alanyl-D-glutamate--2,6-diaminopimelate ligase
MLAGIKCSRDVQVITDRGAAIRQAILESRPGDIVLVAGKGHETYQESNGVRVPFSDEAAVRAVLEEAA